MPWARPTTNWVPPATARDASTNDGEAAATKQSVPAIRASAARSSLSPREPSHETAWVRGAEAEAAVAAALARRCRSDVVFLHDRRLPGRHANIDHLAVAPSGVRVIDTKRYRGKATIKRPLLGPSRLIIDHRDRTSLIDGLDRQVQAVRVIVATLDADVPIRGALCMVDTDLPLVGTLQLNGYALLTRRALAKRLNAPGPLDPISVRALSGALAARFPPA